LFIRPNETSRGSRCGAQWSCDGGLAVLCADADGRGFFVSRLARGSVIFPDRRQRALRAAEPPGRYVVRVAGKPWTPEHDEFLRNQWHLLPVEEIARRLGRSVAAVNRRRCKLGIRRYDGDELTLRSLQRATGLAGRRWREVIEHGWLQVRLRVRRSGAKPVGCVTVDGVRSLLKRHPEVLDYRLLRAAVRSRLELDSLPEPPRYKRLLCTAASSVNAAPAGTRDDAGGGEGLLSPAVSRNVRPSCAQIGGTAFWAPIYTTPTCPRCGGAVSAYSPDGVYADALPKRGMDRAVGRTAIAGLRAAVPGCDHLTARRSREATAARNRMPTSDHEEEKRASASRQTP
jgi:hypothetical protein